MNLRVCLNVLISGLVCLLATSCLGSDSSDGNDQSMDGTFPTLGTVDYNPLHQLQVESDTYGTLLPINAQRFIEQKADTAGQRVLVSVKFVDNATPPASAEGAHKVDVAFVQKVLTKDADDLRVAGTSDVFGHSGIEITSAGISRYHLNIQYSIYGGNPPARAHRISLVLDEHTSFDAEGNLRVSLRHNAEGDAEMIAYWGVVSFNLFSIPEWRDKRFKGFSISYEGSNSPWIVRQGEPAEARIIPRPIDVSMD